MFELECSSLGAIVATGGFTQEGPTNIIGGTSLDFRGSNLGDENHILLHCRIESSGSHLDIMLDLWMTQLGSPSVDPWD